MGNSEMRLALTAIRTATAPAPANGCLIPSKGIRFSAGAPPPGTCYTRERSGGLCVKPPRHFPMKTETLRSGAKDCSFGPRGWRGAVGVFSLSSRRFADDAEIFRRKWKQAQSCGGTGTEGARAIGRAGALPRFRHGWTVRVGRGGTALEYLALDNQEHWPIPVLGQTHR